MYEYKAIVTNVVDGDTIDAEVDLGFHLNATLRFRLLGVDCPERGQEGYAAAKEFVEQAVLGQHVTVKTKKGDSFGRWLCVVQYDAEGEFPKDLQAELIKAGLATAFKG